MLPSKSVALYLPLLAREGLREDRQASGVNPTLLRPTSHTASIYQPKEQLLSFTRSHPCSIYNPLAQQIFVFKYSLNKGLSGCLATCAFKWQLSMSMSQAFQRPCLPLSRNSLGRQNRLFPSTPGPSQLYRRVLKLTPAIPLSNQDVFIHPSGPTRST